MRTAAPILTKSIARAAISESIVRSETAATAAAACLVRRIFSVVMECGRLFRDAHECALPRKPPHALSLRESAPNPHRFFLAAVAFGFRSRSSNPTSFHSSTHFRSLILKGEVVEPGRLAFSASAASNHF
jgi:hypothetical protein